MKTRDSRTKTGMSYGPIFRKLDAGQQQNQSFKTSAAGHHAVHAGAQSDKSTRHLFCTVSVSARGYEGGSDHAHLQSRLVQCWAVMRLSCSGRDMAHG